MPLPNPPKGQLPDGLLHGADLILHFIKPDLRRPRVFAEGFGKIGRRPLRFTEHARLSQANNDGSRAFDIGGLSHLSASAYDALTPSKSFDLARDGHTM